MTLNTTHILLLISSGLVIIVLIFHWLRQAYKISKSKSIRSKYPQTVAALLNRGLMENSNETIFDISKKEYIQEEKEREFVSRVLTKYPFAISHLIGKPVFETYTLHKDQVHTLYSHRDRLASIQTSEADKAFYERRYDRLKWQYPNGIEIYKHIYIKEGNSVSIKEYDEHQIKELEYQYEETQLFKVWQEEQKEFTQFCRNTISNGLDCYYHDIDFAIPGYPGMDSNIHYRVCQHLKHFYCNDDKLDSIHFPDITQKRHTLEKYKNKTIDSSKETFKNTVALINAIQEKYGDLFVIFSGCDASKDANIEFGYKKLQQLLDDKNIRYYEIKEGLPAYIPIHYVVVIELCTYNTHLTSLSKSIIESFRRIPCFTYISIFKELDSDEMANLIEDKNKEEEAKLKE